MRTEQTLTHGIDNPDGRTARTATASVAMRPVDDNHPSVKRDHRLMYPHTVVARLIRRDVVLRTSIRVCSRIARRDIRRTRGTDFEKTIDTGEKLRQVVVVYLLQFQLHC